MSPRERKGKMKKNKRYFKQNKTISSQICVTSAECGDNSEKMVRKFIRKVKKEGIIDEVRSRSHYIKPSAIKSEEKRRVRKMIEKENKKNQELLNTRPAQRKAHNKRSRR